MNRAIVLLALTTGCILVPIDRTAVTRTAEPTDAGAGNTSQPGPGPIGPAPGPCALLKFPCVASASTG